MAMTITTHCKMGIVDSSGNVNVLYPQTTGADVAITPNSVVSATTVQNLVDSLKASAFISNFLGIDDTSTTSTTKTYSASKISALNSDQQHINDVTGAKNLLDNIAYSQTINGVTFTINDDGSVTVSTDENGATGLAELVLSTIDLAINEKYIVSGCPVVNNEKYYIAITNYGIDSGEGLVIDTESSSTETVSIIVTAGTIFETPVVFRPMIRLDGTSSDFVPHAKTNRELTNDMKVAGGSSTLTVEETDGVFYLIWHGMSDNCPYSVQLDGANYNLYFSYTT